MSTRPVTVLAPQFMIGVTVFGLIFTPVFYVVTRWLAGRMSRQRAGAATHPAE